MGWCRVVGPRGLCRPLDEKQATNKQPGPSRPVRAIRRANTGQGRAGQGAGHRGQGRGHGGWGTGHGAHGARGTGQRGSGAWGGPNPCPFASREGLGALVHLPGLGVLAAPSREGLGTGQGAARGTGHGAQGAGGTGQEAASWAAGQRTAGHSGTAGHKAGGRAAGQGRAGQEWITDCFGVV